MDINLTNAECIVQKTNLTETVVTNICNGNVTYVAHGTLDFLLGAFLAVAVVAVCVMLFKILTLD